MKIQVKRVRSNGFIPQYKTEGAAGLDLHAALEADVKLVPKQRELIPTGLALAIPDGIEGQVRPRSGLALSLGVSIVNTPGTIDSDYRGELMVLLINLGQENVVIKPGDRIAQLVFAPVIRVELEEVQELDSTGRGSGGYGSTGI